MHPKVAMFLRERDRAVARRDPGIIRSMNVELRRLGVRDDATLQHPNGPPAKNRQTNGAASKSKTPKVAKCEHGSVAERCPECNEELAVN